MTLPDPFSMLMRIDCQLLSCNIHVYMLKFYLTCCFTKYHELSGKLQCAEHGNRDRPAGLVICDALLPTVIALAPEHRHY